MKSFGQCRRKEEGRIAVAEIDKRQRKHMVREEASREKLKGGDSEFGQSILAEKLKSCHSSSFDNTIHIGGSDDCGSSFRSPRSDPCRVPERSPRSWTALFCIRWCGRVPECRSSSSVLPLETYHQLLIGQVDSEKMQHGCMWRMEQRSERPRTMESES